MKQNKLVLAGLGIERIKTELTNMQIVYEERINDLENKCCQQYGEITALEERISELVEENKGLRVAVNLNTSDSIKDVRETFKGKWFYMDDEDEEAMTDTLSAETIEKIMKG